MEIDEKQTYLEKVNIFEFLVKKCIKLSYKTYGKQVKTWEEEISSDLFGRICALSFSLLKLIPESDLYKRINFFEFWDYSSICILSRTILDSYLIFYHYCMDIPNNVNERIFKKLYWDYYIDFKTIKNLELIKSQHPELLKLKKRNYREKLVIQNNNYFKSLSDKLKNRIERCEIFQIPNNSEIAVKSGFNMEFYKSNYEYLSRYIHSDSFCIDQISIFKADSIHAYQLIGSALDLLIIILSFSTRDFIKICSNIETENDVLIKNIIMQSENIAKNFMMG